MTNMSTDWPGVIVTGEGGSTASLEIDAKINRDKISDQAYRANNTDDEKFPQSVK